MLKTLTTTAGLVVLVSTFALAGQTATKPSETPKAATSSPQPANQATDATKHQKKHHKKHHAQAATQSHATSKPQNARKQ